MDREMNSGINRDINRDIDRDIHKEAGNHADYRTGDRTYSGIDHSNTGNIDIHKENNNENNTGTALDDTESNRKKRRRRKKKRDPITMLLIAAMLIIAVAAGIPLVRDLRFSLGIRQENEALRASFVIDEAGSHEIDFAALTAMNPDICGWITIDDTRIDFPLVQGSSNLEYLNKNAYGENAIYGAIFLDTRSRTDFGDIFSLLHGHHMADGNMLGDVDLFEEERFFRQHGTGTLYTPEGTYALEAIAYMVVDAADPYIFEPEQWTAENAGELTDYISSESMYTKEWEQTAPGETSAAGDAAQANTAVGIDAAGPHLLALSTCSTHGDRDRSILILTMTPTVK